MGLFSNIFQPIKNKVASGGSTGVAVPPSYYSGELTSYAPPTTLPGYTAPARSRNGMVNNPIASYATNQPITPYTGPTTPGGRSAPAATVPGANLSFLSGVRSTYETLYDPYGKSYQDQLAAALADWDLKRRQTEYARNQLAPNTDLQKARIDLAIQEAMRGMGRANESADSSNWLTSQNLARLLAGGQDWINTEGGRVNSLLSDLALRNEAEARGINYNNFRLQLAFQGLGLDKEGYINTQNMINNRQTNLNTMTNLQSEQTQRDFAGQKRSAYDDTVSRGALTSGGARQNLRDIDESLANAQSRLKENLRSGTEELRGQRTAADLGWQRNQLDYQGTEAGIREESASARDRMRLNESEGGRLRSGYEYDTRERQRSMEGARDSAQNDITQTNLNRAGTLDSLSTNIAQWGIDKQLLDQQMADAAKQLGFQAEQEHLDYKARTNQLNAQEAALYRQMQEAMLQATPLAQQNPWLFQAAFGNKPQTNTPTNNITRGPARAV